MKFSNLLKVMFLVVAGFMLASCKYTSSDYVNDVKALTKKTVDNASTYSEADWKQVAEEYKALSEKGKEVWKDATAEQREELRQWNQEMMDEWTHYNSKEMNQKVGEALDKAAGKVKDVLKNDSVK